MPPARFSIRVQPLSASSSHAIVLRPPAAQVTSMAWSRAGSSPSRSSSSSTGIRWAPGMCPDANSAGVRTSSTKRSGCCCRSTSAGAGSMGRYAAPRRMTSRGGGSPAATSARCMRATARPRSSCARLSSCCRRCERISAIWRSAARSRCDSCHTMTATATMARPPTTLSMARILALTPPMRHAHPWTMMRAILVREPGDEHVLVLGDAPAPVLGPSDVRIRIRATAVNRADLMQREGLYPPPPGVTPILGLECAGEVAEVGAEVRDVRVGQRVMALLPGGGYAEEVCVDHGSVLAVPDGMSDEEAAAFPEVFLTAFSNLFMPALGAIAAGESALVHGGGGGVGTAAILLLREAGLACFVTAGSDEKCRECVALGATAAINYRTEDFAARVHALTNGAGVDVVLDHIGASYLAKNLAALAPGGRLVLIGLMGGAQGEIKLAQLLVRRLAVIGSTLRGRSIPEKARIVDGFRARFADALAARRLRVPIYRVLPLEQASEAHRLMQSSAHFGKIVLRVR